jgi:hypothetical protein
MRLQHLHLGRNICHINSGQMFLIHFITITFAPEVASCTSWSDKMKIQVVLVSGFVFVFVVVVVIVLLLLFFFSQKMRSMNALIDLYRQYLFSLYFKYHMQSLHFQLKEVNVVTIHHCEMK